jgi:3-phenylpropionate/cinnamic acid dioxygenase small subunit
MYLCVKVIDFPISTIINNLNTQLHDRSLSWLGTGKSISLTHKYMTAHSPGLVQAKSITLTQIHDRSLSWLGTGKINNPNTQIHDRSFSWLGSGKTITVTHKYMTAHSPGLVQAKSITLTQIHDRSLP